MGCPEEMEMLTLGVHEVADGNGVVLVSVHRLLAEHGLSVALGPTSHVFLAESLHLEVDGKGFLQCPVSVFVVASLRGTQ